jgi:hypothetical protein
MLGLHAFGVTRADRMAVVPVERTRELAALLGKPIAEGEYLLDDRELYVVATDVAVRNGLLTPRLVHELGHDYTLHRSKRAQRAHPFIIEALAGMAEARYRDEQVRRGERPSEEARLIKSKLGNYYYLPGRYFDVGPDGKVFNSQGALAACALSLVSQISGITEDEIWSQGSSKSGQHIDLIEQSLEALGPGTADDLRIFRGGSLGVLRAAIHIQSKAIECGARMENHDVFIQEFPPHL